MGFSALGTANASSMLLVDATAMHCWDSSPARHARSASRGTGDQSVSVNAPEATATPAQGMAFASKVLQEMEPARATEILLLVSGLVLNVPIALQLTSASTATAHALDTQLRSATETVSAAAALEELENVLAT